MKYAVCGVVAFAVIGFASASADGIQGTASKDVACEAALDGSEAAWDVVRAYSELPTPTTKQQVDLFYAAQRKGIACNEVIRATCGCTGGFICPPASATAINQCQQIVIAPTSSGTQNYSQVVKSQSLGGGIYYADLAIPMDAFTPERSSLSVAVDGDVIDDPRQLNRNGDNLYIFPGEGVSKFRCSYHWYQDIEQSGITLDSLWDGQERAGSGPTNRDAPFQLANEASCQVLANQPFVVTIRQSVAE